MRMRFWLALILFAGIATPRSPGAQTTAAVNPPLVIRSLAGSDLFQFYCATCHGRDGSGNGPVAAALQRPPTDLRRLTVRNAGVFPRARVAAYITNGGELLTAAHGSSEMPVWGPVFRGLDPSDTRVTLRIANLTDYIASIQAKE